MKKTYLILVASAAIMACGAPESNAEKAEETTMETEAATEEVAVEEEYEMAAEGDSLHFGRLIDESGAKSVEEFAMAMEGQDSLDVKIHAVARDVCQKKGCWMKVELADGEMMRIKFKDYGFFVPMDISGKEVVFSGKAYTETTPVEELRHYAEDGGATEEEIAAITEDETKVTFMADGVMILGQ